MKIVIIGGVAGGASAAARLARLDAKAEIVMFERGPYVSFANCGLPYHVGKVIPQRDSLLLMTPEKFKKIRGIDVRINQEIIKIDPSVKTVTVKKTDDGSSYSENYDKLIIATGSSPFMPDIPGVNDPAVLPLWTITDMDKVMAQIDRGAKHVVVAGGGFIGLEVAENLILRGIETTIVQRPPQVLPTLDPEMASLLTAELERHGVKVCLNNALAGIKREQDSTGLVASLKDGTEIAADLIIMGLGVRPNSQLARDAGLELGEHCGIKVNKHLQTSNPDIYAVGDVIEVNDPVLNKTVMIPLAGPANRQGRIAANNICGANDTYNGTIGTNVCKVFDITAASAGVNEKRLKQEKIEYLKAYLFPVSHAGYYPGAETMAIKAIFDRNGKILGAQIVGRDGVDKRIDVLATAIKNNLTVHDLAELELAYAPPYGSAKDPVNFIGFVAENILNETTRAVYPDAIPAEAFLLDVREPDEVTAGTIAGSTNIPLGKLRDNLDKLPKDKLIVAFCRVGIRGYNAECLLRDNGFNVTNLSGGILGWQLFNPRPISRKPITKPSTGAEIMQNITNEKTVELNACGLQCPGPIVAVKNKLDAMQNGELLKITASDSGFMNDLPPWCEATSNQLVSLNNIGGKIEAVVRKGQQGETAAIAGPAHPARTTIVLFSNDLDKAMAAFIMATGFASIGQEVSIFFTFWGLNVLRKDNPPAVKKDILSRMFGMMMPCGAKKLALSKMHFGGAGTAMMKYVMNSKNVDSLPALIGQARLMGIRFIACEMAMNVMGIKQEEMIDGVETAGVAKFAALSAQSNATLFI